MRACPCGSGAPLAQCCAPLLDGFARATTAEQLMRSRFTAYALAQVDYLMETHAARTRPPREDVAGSADDATFTELQILETTEGRPDDTRGTVTFMAHFTAGGKTSAMLERSRFEKVRGQWFYVDGDLP